MVNSRYPLVCAPHPWLPKNGASLSRSYGGNLPSSFNIVLSSALVYSTSPPVSVLVRPIRWCYFQAVPGHSYQSNKEEWLSTSVTSTRLRNINRISIDYAFRPRLRCRLTLLGLTLGRKPWAFGESVSHTLYRYSYLNSLFPYLQPSSRTTFAGLGNAPLPRNKIAPAASVRNLSPVHLRRQTSNRPVSYYAFFK